jgi:prevent-host-death family protein
MRELNQRTSEVMNEILEEGTPTLVSRYGRPVAVIVPVPSQAETYLLGALVDDTIRGLGEASTESLDDLAERLNLDPEQLRLRAEVTDP